MWLKKETLKKVDKGAELLLPTITLILSFLVITNVLSSSVNLTKSVPILIGILFSYVLIIKVLSLLPLKILQYTYPLWDILSQLNLVFSIDDYNEFMIAAIAFGIVSRGYNFFSFITIFSSKSKELIKKWKLDDIYINFNAFTLLNNLLFLHVIDYASRFGSDFSYFNYNSKIFWHASLAYFLCHNLFQADERRSAQKNFTKKQEKY